MQVTQDNVPGLEGRKQPPTRNTETNPHKKARKQTQRRGTEANPTKRHGNKPHEEGPLPSVRASRRGRGCPLYAAWRQPCARIRLQRALLLPRAACRKAKRRAPRHWRDPVCGSSLLLATRPQVTRSATFRLKGANASAERHDTGAGPGARCCLRPRDSPRTPGDSATCFTHLMRGLVQLPVLVTTMR